MNQPLRLFTCTEFKGHYPVGVAAVIVATDETQAIMLLEERLTAQGLRQKIKLDQIIPVPLSFPNCQILCNGDY